MHLDFSIVAKILDSCELNIHSEVEIFNAVIAWLKHNSVQRIKYAKQLLLRVRISLLSEHASKHILDKTSSFTENRKENKECFNTMKDILLKINKLFHNKSSYKYTNRYCNQKELIILVFGGSK